MKGPAQPEVIEGFRLSAQQQVLWQSADAAADPVGCVVSLTGPVTDTFVRDALARLVEQNGILRTSFRRLPEMALPLQVVRDRGSVRWRSQDVSRLGDGSGDAARRDLFAAAADEPVDLGGDSPLAAVFVRLDDERAVLYLQLPAAVADAPTMVNLVDQLGEAMGGRGDSRAGPAPGLQYVQYSEWRHELAADSGEEGAAGADYWARYRPSTAGADIGAPEPDPGARRTAPRARLRLGAEAGERLDRVARRLGAGPDAVILAAWAGLASRLAGRADVVVETLFDGRRFEEFCGMLGPFTDRLPVGVAVTAGRTCAAVIGEIAGVLAGHREWLEFAPGARLAKVGAEYGFGYLERPARRRYGSLELDITALTDRVSCPGPTLLCERVGRELVLGVAVPPGPAAAARPGAQDMVGYLATALDSLLDDADRGIDALALIAPRQRGELLSRFGAGARRPSQFASFPALFAGQVERTPDAVALTIGRAQLSYARLDRQAGAVTRRLAERGVRRGDVVALVLERGRLALTAMLGILKAGAAFLVIDPGDPAARKAFMCADSGAMAVITDTADAGQAVGGCPVLTLPGDLGAGPGEAEPPVAPLSAADAAYVCYTSGTTGAPNGVLVQHGSLVNYLRWVHREVTRDVQLPLVSRLTFDASLKQVLGPLLHGGQIWMLPEATLAEPRLLFQALRERAGAGQRIGFNGVPALWATVLSAAEEAPPGDAEAFRRGMRSVLLGGEALPEKLMARTEAFLPDAELWNLYGPTEATANASAGRVGGAHGLSIGRPVDNGQILLLDRFLEPVPPGLPGRLFVAGAGIARCYIGHPDLTARRFRPHPFSDVPGDRIYDTGDLARFLPDGRIEFLGRDDLQVKVSGFRIEPEGVEATMSALPGVREAALAVLPAASGGAELVGCLVPDSPAPLPVAELRSLLAGALPRYAVPTRIVQVDALPRTRTAKLDRSALAELARHDEHGPAAVAGQRSLIEAEVAGIWARLLRAGSIGPDDNFFSLGGHSLLTVELISRAQEATGVQLPAQAVFEAPTLREFSARIEDELAGGGGAVRPALEPVPRDRPAPLSFSQQRSLLLESLDPGARRHNVLAARRIVGTVSEDAVREALAAIVARHEILRTGFVAGPPPAQVIAQEVAVPLTTTQLGPVGGEGALAEVQHRADLLLGQAFTLQSPPLMRAELVRLGDDDAVLLLVLHRLVCDGWAKALLFDEFASRYGAAITGAAKPLPDLAVQYADYATWERRCVPDQVLAEQLGYWRQRLAGTGPLRMPVDHPRTKAPSHRGHTAGRRLSEDITQVLRDISADAGSTLFMTTLAAFAMLLAYYSGQSDIVVVTPVTARKHTDLRVLIGPFLNLVALRIDLTSDPSFAELLRRVRETALAANARQDLPFERLAEELLAGPGGSRSSAFPVMFNYAHAAEQEVDMGPGTVLRIVDVEPGSSAYDLEFLVEEEPKSLQLRLVADLDLYEPTTAERILAAFEAVLRSVGEEPDRPMSEHFISVSRDRALAGPAQAGQASAGRRGFVDTIFTARARTGAHLPAVAAENGGLSYGELDRRSNQLARYLAGAGVVPGQIVGLLTGAAADLVVAMLAVVKIGAGFLVLNDVPNDVLSDRAPAERLRRDMADGRVAVLVTSADHAARVGPVSGRVLALDTAAAAIAACPADPPRIAGRDPRNPAYVTPGAVISHESLARATATRSAYYAEPVVSMLVPGPAGSERFVAAAFWTLCSGGCLLVPAAADGEPGRLTQLIDEGQVTHLMTTTSLYLSLHRTGQAGLDSLRTVVVSGEPLYGPQVDAHFRQLPDTGLFHEYRPPECGGWGLVYQCSPADAALDLVPVSASIAGTGWRVLNRSWLQVPEGVDGELFAGGPHAAIRCPGPAASTAGRLVPDPSAGVPGARMQRTGDLARVRLDGSVVVFGRLDEQVRLPGLLEHRIALEEAEAALLRQDEVREAALARADGAPGSGRLTAYLVPAGPGAIDEAALDGRLRSALPDHLVPGRYVQMGELPRRPDGAVDRAALAGRTDDAGQADEARPPGQADEGGPAELAARLGEIWAEEFDLAQVQPGDDFFALGGNSLVALHLLARIEDEFDVTLPLQALFEAPTVKQLATIVDVWLAEAQ